VHPTTPAGAVAMVGGTGSVYAEVSSSISKDLRLIFPIAAGLILLVLFAMLRSAVAPLYLLMAVGLEFAATLGAAVIVFQHAAGQPGTFTLPLVLFLFVVAIGTDYNRLMFARVSDGFQAGLSARHAVASAIGHAAPPITAAGLVLAASFGSMMIYDDYGSKEIGFGMAIGSCSPRSSSRRSWAQRSPHPSASAPGGQARSPGTRRPRSRKPLRGLRPIAHSE
jgi:RND superfamily putative drug exporter